MTSFAGDTARSIGTDESRLGQCSEMSRDRLLYPLAGSLGSWGMPKRRSLGLWVAVLAVALAAVGLWTWRAAVGTARPAGNVAPRREIGGIVSDRAVGPISFGSSPPRPADGAVQSVILWAGNSYSSSRPGSTANDWEIPRHDKRAYVISYYDCKGLTKRSICHTLFGFLNDKLVAFKTESAAFSFPNGVRPGMTDLAFQKREPKAKTVAGCRGLRRLPSPAGTSRYVGLGFTRPWGDRPSRWGVTSLYAFSGHPVFTLVFKRKDGDFLCG